MLAWRCLRGLVRRYGPAYPWRDKPSRGSLLARLRKELEIVSRTGYAGYFLIFGEVVTECRRRSIPLLARGSAAGSLICYALGVANVCPFRFGLSFERFLNRERLRHSKLPDIDLDLPWDRREEIMSWLYERYGAERVAMIGGFAHFKGRGAVAEVAKARGVPAHEAHAWTKRLPHGSLRKFLRDREGYVEARGALADERFREALEDAAGLEGLPRHPMMHPCGMVIADRSLLEFTPLRPSGGGFAMTQFSMDPIEDLGLLKMDLLGQAGLSVIRDCVDNLQAEGLMDPSSPIPDGLDYTDDRIYAMIRTGGARGVFHIESPAMTSLLALCRCADIDCLVATVSVIRPGAANEDKKTRFARRYLGLEEPEYAHPVLEEVLADTYGLMVYEEHILLVANRFAGMDLGTADLLRRILIRKTDDHALEELETVFRSCARQRGRGEEEIETVWRELRDFSGYMFNKAHGAAYAIEAFEGSWLKFHWPLHFLAAVLNNRRGFYEPLVYVLEILGHGGTLVLPDVQVPHRGYRVEGRRVHIPLWQIGGLGEAFLAAWERERRKAPFEDWQDFVRRTGPHRAEAEALARAGALRGFFEERHEAVWQATRIGGTGGRKERKTAQPDLPGVDPVPAGEGLPRMQPREMAAAEAGLLGYPVTLDPFSFWMEPIDRGGTVPVSALWEHLGRECEVAGLQVCNRLHRTRGGELMKFVSLADPAGMAEVVLFPETYRELGWTLSRSRAARLRILVEPDATGSGLSLTVVPGCC
jgi:error-prone DNA polymerase